MSEEQSKYRVRAYPGDPDSLGRFPDKKVLARTAFLPEKPVKPFELHPKERELIELIRELRYGMITSLRVQHGLPEVADIPLRKVKFTGEKEG